MWDFGGWVLNKYSILLIWGDIRPPHPAEGEVNGFHYRVLCRIHFLKDFSGVDIFLTNLIFPPFRKLYFTPQM